MTAINFNLVRLGLREGGHPYLWMAEKFPMNFAVGKIIICVKCGSSM